MSTEGSALYGDLPLIMSAETTDRKILSVLDINEQLVDQEIIVRAFASVVRGKGKCAFLLLRTQIATIQAAAFVQDKSDEQVNFVKYIRGIPVESLVEVVGKLVKTDRPVTSATIQNFEIQISQCHCVSKSQPTPVVVADCSRVTDDDTEDAAPQAKQDKSRPTVSQKLRLDNRVLDLRTIDNQGIFRIQSKIGQFFREYLYQHGFQEIHTPKLIPTASEGGANVFKVAYFDTFAYLAQSPQLYKQMAVVSGMPRVFEVGPVFRAENSFTHRHLTEFTGLDAEMEIKENYHEALEIFKDLLATIFNRLLTECRADIDAVRSQFPSTDVVINPVIVSFKDAVQMLRDAGMQMEDFQDLTTELEKKLGELVKEKYNTDFYILDKFPAGVRPFYTMPDPHDNRYSNSFDMFLRGEEIVSGAQRIHDSELLLKRAAELKVDLTPIQPYVDCFKYGAPPHAGLGCGLDRMTFLFLGLKNVRRGSMFPRDPSRLNP